MQFALETCHLLNPFTAKKCLDNTQLQEKQILMKICSSC